MTNITGFVAPGFERVLEAFAQNFVDSLEVGATTSVYLHGKHVVDLQGGHVDEARTIPYTSNNVQLVFSSTKGAAALCVAMLADRGLIDYTAPVAQYWPEFAQGGKAGVTVEQMLSHQAGLYTVDNPPSLDEVLAWGPVCAALAAQAPYWEPGTQHGYHALTYGWLAGELVRKVDGRNIGRFFGEEVAAPLGLDFWIGLPEAMEPRVAPLIAADPFPPEVAEMAAMFMGPDTIFGKAMGLSGTFGGLGDASEMFNSRKIRAAEIPAANGVTNASSLSRMYAGAMGHIDGVHLVSPATIDYARITRTSGADLTLLMESTFGCGFMTHGITSLYGGPGSFGHTGAGGSVGFGHPESGVAFGYVMNKMDNSLTGDPRTIRLIDAVYACL